jgi:hypothetical protein
MSKGKLKEESMARFMIQSFECEGLETTQLSSENALRLSLVGDDYSDVGVSAYKKRSQCADFNGRSGLEKLERLPGALIPVKHI